MDVKLYKFNYRYMAYELELLHREIKTLVPNAEIEEKSKQIVLHYVNNDDLEKIKRLTYISQFEFDGCLYDTEQYKLECSNNWGQKRQNTRYASHGLHEYKGKFNPQIVHAIINTLGLNLGAKVIDPFCGSGTTLVESSLMGISSFGTDINPLAVLLSQLKLDVMKIDCSQARKLLKQFLSNITVADPDCITDNTERYQYLKKWIPADTLSILEQIRINSSSIDPTTALFFKFIASNLIREYSLQEPTDLRIRKRTSPLPNIPFLDIWTSEVLKQINNIEASQKALGTKPTDGTSMLFDIKGTKKIPDLFDAAITSPPYATALPYIDTQRISLVWLDLCEPQSIMSLESRLIGSREFYKIQKNELFEKMSLNHDKLPIDVINFIVHLQTSLSEHDGFRKRAVPLLLYRYFTDMKQMFMNVKKIIKPKGKYVLVVGQNKTTIGDILYQIDTPKLLSVVANSTGWNIVELVPLQTYQRYGLNSKNSINNETMIILENSTND